MTTKETEREDVHIVSDDEREGDDSSSLSSDFLNDADSSFDNDDYDDDANYNGNGSSSSSHFKRKKDGLPPKQHNPEDEKIMLSAEHVIEQRFVTCTRLLVLVVMSTAAALIGFFTYRYVVNDQREDMNQSYDETTLQIQDESFHKFQYILQSLSIASSVATTLATTTSSSSNTNNDDSSSSWPLVTLPNFESWAGQFFKENNDANNNNINNIKINMTMSVIVTDNQRNIWNVYSASHAPEWVLESTSSSMGGDTDVVDTDNTITPYLWKHDTEHETTNGGGNRLPELGPSSAVYAASWQSTMPIDLTEINHNDLDNDIFRDVYKAMIDIRDNKDNNNNNNNGIGAVSKIFPCDGGGGGGNEYCIWMLEPILAKRFGRDTVVAYFKAKVPLGYLFSTNRQQEQENDDTIEGRGGMIHAVVEGINPTCLGESFTMEVNSDSGDPPTYLGVGDLHDTAFDSTMVEYSFNEHTATTTAGCDYQVRLYSTQHFEDMYMDDDDEDSSAWILAGSAVGIVASAILAFFLFDCCVRRHQQSLAKSAVKSKAIINSLFPENVRDRLMESERKLDTNSRNNNNNNHFNNSNPFMVDKTPTSSTFFGGGSGGGTGNHGKPDFLSSKPIADFFPHTTVLFADIVGFTAWSSVRDPTQVFTLLETLYNSFDRIAKKRKVFKVETIGDCYVAVTGLPEPMEEHAVVMAKFARQCMFKMMKIVKDLEIHLGPDTGDLSMRFGLHSGPVTAGVLRGEKSRFQLFGDTVNTAARIESTGQRAKVHLSEDTADLIIAAGKGHWVTQREEKVSAKGKGRLQTYWLELESGRNSIDSGSIDLSLEHDLEQVEEADPAPSSGVGNLVAKFEKREKLNSLDDRTRRQADYVSEMLVRALKKIGARRGVSTFRPKNDQSGEFKILEEGSTSQLTVPTDKVSFKCRYGSSKISPNQVAISPEILSQLKDFVTTIAAMYRENAFHSFEHASHVAMSASKLFSRIVTEENSADRLSMSNRMKHKANSNALGDINFGISDDPITEFALVFAALIHDVDHPGIANNQLVTEGSPLATKYGNESVAEKNSIEIAWNLLMKPAYKDFRRCIYSTKSELERFRCLVVNLVLATDILDKNSSSQRARRWEQAFVKTKRKAEDPPDHKAMLVLEHLIQAADIAHTMQHWNVYTKWNRRLFKEMSEAFKARRGKKDPAEYWFGGELTFFDTFVVPLTQRLKDCGVFGDASEEYLNYAKANRRDWQSKGRDTLLDYIGELRGGKRILPNSTHSNTTYSTLSSSNGSQKFWPKPSSLVSLNATSNHSFKPPSSFSLKPASARSGKPPSMFNMKTNRSEQEGP